MVIKDQLGDIHGSPIAAAGRHTIVLHLARLKNSPDRREQTIAPSCSLYPACRV